LAIENVSLADGLIRPLQFVFVELYWRVNHVFRIASAELYANDYIILHIQYYKLIGQRMPIANLVSTAVQRSGLSNCGAAKGQK
jgi:hypothetical protein